MNFTYNINIMYNYITEVIFCNKKLGVFFGHSSEFIPKCKDILTHY